MQFHGFRSIREYERVCVRVGFTTRRIPFHKDSEKYFILITTPPEHPTGTSIETWHLFTADETAEMLDGIIRNDSFDTDCLSKLATNGYYPD